MNSIGPGIGIGCHPVDPSSTVVVVVVAVVAVWVGTAHTAESGDAVSVDGGCLFYLADLAPHCVVYWNPCDVLEVHGSSLVVPGSSSEVPDCNSVGHEMPLNLTSCKVPL